MEAICDAPQLQQLQTCRASWRLARETRTSLARWPKARRGVPPFREIQRDLPPAAPFLGRPLRYSLPAGGAHHQALCTQQRGARSVCGRRQPARISGCGASWPAGLPPPLTLGLLSVVRVRLRDASQHHLPGGGKHARGLGAMPVAMAAARPSSYKGQSALGSRLTGTQAVRLGRRPNLSLRAPSQIPPTHLATTHVLIVQELQGVRLGAAGGDLPGRERGRRGSLRETGSQPGKRTQQGTVAAIARAAAPRKMVQRAASPWFCPDCILALCGAP